MSNHSSCVSAKEHTSHPHPPSPLEGAQGLAADLTRALARSQTIGVDADGYDHHWRAASNEIIVYRGRDSDECERYPLDDFGGTSLDEWVDFVEEKRGWESMGPMVGLAIADDRATKRSCAKQTGER